MSKMKQNALNCKDWIVIRLCASLLSHFDCGRQGGFKAAIEAVVVT